MLEMLLLFTRIVRSLIFDPSGMTNQIGFKARAESAWWTHSSTYVASPITNVVFLTFKSFSAVHQNEVTNLVRCATSAFFFSLNAMLS